MPEDTTTVEPQAGDTGSNPQPQAGNTSTEPQAGESQTNDTISLEEAKKLRSEAASLRQRLRNAETKAKEFDDLKAQIESEKLSEKEKLDKKLADLQAERDAALRERQELRVSNAVSLAATRLNFNDPEDGMRYIKMADLDDDLSNVGDLLKQVLKERPYLAGKAGTTQTSGGATNPSRSQSTAPQVLSWEVIGKMTSEDYNNRRAEIQQWILSNPPRYR